MKQKSKSLQSILAISIIAIVLLSAVAQASALYEPKSTVINKFKQLIDDHRDVASYASLGKTENGKDIWIFRIGNPNGKAIMWDAQLHGGEDMGSQIMFLMAKWLLESNEKTAISILANNYILFVPVIDVDTAVRTNANHVNLNRNFVYNWKIQKGASTNPSSSEYKGPSPGSESETQAVRNAFRTYKPTFYVNTHMWAGPKMFSWAGNNPTIVSRLKAEISTISSQRGVTPYPISSISGYGYAIGDAGYYYGATAFLLEINNIGSPQYKAPPYSTVVDTYYPKCLPILLAMCKLAS